MQQSSRSSQSVGYKSVFSCHTTNWWGKMDKVETLLKEQQLKVSWALQKHHLYIYKSFINGWHNSWWMASRWLCIILNSQFQPRHEYVYELWKGKLYRLQGIFKPACTFVGNVQTAPDGVLSVDFSLAFLAVMLSGLISWWCFGVWNSLVLETHFLRVFCCSTSSYSSSPRV